MIGMISYPPNSMSAPHTPAEVGRLWFDKIWNERDADWVHRLMAPDAIGYLEGGERLVGPAPFIEFQKQFLTTVPDLKLEVLDSIADENSVCVQWQAKGTHTGPGMGVEPSGQPVSFRGVTWFKVKDGQVTAGHDFWNLGGFMQMLANPPGVANA